MKRDSKVFCEHIIDAINHIRQFTQDVSFEEFLQNEEKQAAVLRKLEIIGEATHHLRKLVPQDNISIPWEQINGLRNALIHEYFGVDLEIVWDIVQNDLPKLKEAIAKLHATL